MTSHGFSFYGMWHPKFFVKYGSVREGGRWFQNGRWVTMLWIHVSIYCSLLAKRESQSVHRHGWSLHHLAYCNHTDQRWNFIELHHTTTIPPVVGFDIPSSIREQTLPKPNLLRLVMFGPGRSLHSPMYSARNARNPCRIRVSPHRIVINQMSAFTCVTFRAD